MVAFGLQFRWFKVGSIAEAVIYFTSRVCKKSRFVLRGLQVTVIKIPLRSVSGAVRVFCLQLCYVAYFPVTSTYSDLMKTKVIEARQSKTNRTLKVN